MSGALTSAMATFVSGPRVQSVTVPGSAARSVSTMKSTPCCACSDLRLGQVDAVEAGPAVDVLGGDQVAPHRPLAAGIDRHIAAAGELDHLQGVLGVLVEADIAGDRDDAEHVEFVRRGERQQDGDGVVLTGVGVDDDLAGGRGFLGSNFFGF